MEVSLDVYSNETADINPVTGARAERAIRRGDVFFAILPNAVGAEQAKERPVLIVSNNAANEAGPIVTVIPMTSQVKKRLPTHVDVKNQDGTINTALCEQIRALSGYYQVDIARLLERKDNIISNIVNKLGLKTDKYGYWLDNRFVFNEAAVTEIMNYFNK